MGSCWLCALFYLTLFAGFVWFMVLLIKLTSKVGTLSDRKLESRDPVIDQDNRDDSPGVSQDKDSKRPFEAYQDTRPE